MKDVVLQRFLLGSNASVDAVPRAALACLTARFSFNDFADFLLMACRGDLSDIAGPLIMGAPLVPVLLVYRCSIAVRVRIRARVDSGGDLDVPARERFSIVVHRATPSIHPQRREWA
jgi:hypothetical protein